MREIIAVCRSTKRSRVRVASVLDRYLWRIADRTWRGRASNACLDRMARELRAVAKRNTAVAIHEIRSARESRVPIVRIGSRQAFSEAGIAPVASHAGRRRNGSRAGRDRSLLATVRVGVLFHDLGKATTLFQKKLRRALLRGARPEADAVRHELHSATVWDELVGALDDEALIERLRTLDTAAIDAACERAMPRLHAMHANPASPIGLTFADREDTIAHAIGMLVLTHHRLPEGDESHRALLARRHVSDADLRADDLRIADGDRFWGRDRWLRRLRATADELEPGSGAHGLDMALRVALMCADHVASASKEVSDSVDGHLGNTKDGCPADSLDLHVHRVWRHVPGCFDMLHRHRESYPAIGEDEIPIDLLVPEAGPGPFVWQALAARAAREVCGASEGGFFGCLMAGTGTGKTRAAPTVLAAAAFADRREERRYLRMSLALGLRTLASQSAREYVNDLGFDEDDVAVLIGRAPVRFADDGDVDDAENEGSESLVTLPRWLRVERANGTVPAEGSSRESDWLRRLSHDSSRGLPASLDRVLEVAGGRNASARSMLSAPVLIGTIDHLMDVASPTRARYLYQAVRVLTSDLILDEIDQYEPEDIAAIGRLIYQAGAGGRRVIVMSATLPEDVASVLHEAYRLGWRAHAAATGQADHVNVVCVGNVPTSCAANRQGEPFATIYGRCRDAMLDALRADEPRRRGSILPSARDWSELVEQVDASCTELHARTATLLAGIRVSIGFVRMTRIAHTTALASQLPAGPRDGRLRLKICLHSRFPRLHRSWMERELRMGLVRKGDEPNAALASWCERHGLFERARGHGCHELEIVVITSPVIETGNDLDFDWAVIDPSSIRAVIQASGRVWRHRTYRGGDPNVHILGRSPIAMSEGRLMWPGVETKPHPETLVGRVTLDAFEGRHFAELSGDETFERIDASTVLDEGKHIPLHTSEGDLRRRMLRLERSDDPLGAYVRGSTARLNRRMTLSRKFRRSVTRDVLYFQEEESSGALRWLVDLAPGTRQSAPRPAASRGLSIADQGEEFLVFGNLGRMAIADYLGDDDREIGEWERRTLSEVSIPDFGDRNQADPEPQVTYQEWTGFTRGLPEDLLEPFGKNTEEQ